MTPLQEQIISGRLDSTLLTHLNRLEDIESGRYGSAGISSGELFTLLLLRSRLYALTCPDGKDYIRCPCCTIALLDDDDFIEFKELHSKCSGRRFGCKCEWERLCGGTTLLSRISGPCEQCKDEPREIEMREEELSPCMECPGCVECTPKNADALL